MGAGERGAGGSGGRVGAGERGRQPLRRAPSSPDTVSRGRTCASVRECPEQWGISKLASGKEPTGLFARKHLLTPYTGEAIIRQLLPPRARSRGRAAHPSYIGFPQRFCEAKDLGEEVTPFAPSGHLPQTHPKKILRLFLGTPGREAREWAGGRAFCVFLGGGTQAEGWARVTSFAGKR